MGQLKSAESDNIHALDVSKFIYHFVQFCQFIHCLQAIRNRRVGVFSRMETTQYRAMIKLFVLEGLSAPEAYTKIVSVLKESTPSFPTEHRWV